MSGTVTPSTLESEDNIKHVINSAAYQPSHLSSSAPSINGWDSETIYYVKKIGDLAGAYNWIHNNTAFWYGVVDYILHFTVLLLQAPSFAGILATIAEEADTIYVKIILAAFVAVGFIVKGMHIYLKFPGKISDRRSSATRYSTIFAKVRNELIKNDEDRREANDFIDEIEEEFTGCYSDSPSCWSIVVRRYLLMMKGKTDLKYSELFGIREIKIRRRKMKQNPQMFSESPRKPKKNRIKTPRIKSKLKSKSKHKTTTTTTTTDTSSARGDVERGTDQPLPSSSSDSEVSPRGNNNNNNNNNTPRQGLTAKMMSVFDIDLLKMGKAQKQYHLDRYFIEDELL